MQDPQRHQVDINYDAFQRVLGSIIHDNRDQYALMRDREIVGYFAKPGDADREGDRRFPDGCYSIQQVTEEPVELGLYANGID